MQSLWSSWLNPASTHNRGLIELTQESSWIDLMIAYLKTSEQPEDKIEARILWLKAARYVLYNESSTGEAIPCHSKSVTPSKAKHIMRKIHKGICGNHAGGQSLAFNALGQGYYWPTMKTNCMEYACKCHKCQQFAPISKAHMEELTSMTSPWQFVVWEINLIGRLPKGRGSV